MTFAATDRWRLHRPSASARASRGHWRALFALAWPVMLSRAGVVLMSMADVVMVGRYDTLALAELSLGNARVHPGAGGRHRLPRRVVVGDRRAEQGAARRGPAGDRAARPVVGGAGRRGSPRSRPVRGEPALRLIGQTPGARRGRRRGRADAGAPARFFQLVFVGASFYLEGTGRTKPGLVAMVVRATSSTSPSTGC